MAQEDTEHHDGTVVQEERPKLQRPPLYKVIVMNDDYTPMEFVVHVLQKFFRMPFEKARHVMLEVHTKGSAVAGTYTAEIAETKVAQVNQYARDNQHPLLCTLERA